ncbi:hypothetical protein OG875_09990 [Streptomyces sp. NBC_01498]|uniref:hypothetical protein n=1 Tax=Streptomyces sp. NBC_01498 TaxID=2975870 RepID=UPI002E7B7163|nr:hypothetical protein [Streptomyces sp. NBC_01498]WTL24903.1 hypothetical protein OG875_09990 [Streptomyces sp. NBC_01498]
MRRTAIRGGPRDDRGTSATEYAGMVVVVAAVVGALVGTGVDTTIAEQLKCLVRFGPCDTGGGGENQAAPKTDADYEPPLCQISSISDKAGAKGKLLFIEWGEEYGFQQQTFQSKTDVNGDGTVDDRDQQVMMTFTDAASVAAKKDWKPGAKVGKFGSDKVELGAGIKVTNGDTWVFDSEEEAAKFRDDIEELKTYELANRHSNSRGGGLGNSILYLFDSGPMYEEEQLRKRIEERLGNRHISYGKVGLEASAAGGLKLSPGDEKKLSATLGGSFKFSPEVTWTDNTYRNIKSYTYSAAIEYTGKVGYEAGPLSGESSGTTTQTGTITVSHDKTTGELLRIDMTRTVEKGATKDGVTVGGDNGKDGDDKRGGSGSVKGTENRTGIEVVTNSVVLKPGPEGAEQRAIAQKWLDGSGDNAAPFSYMFDDHAPTKRPGADDPFGQLLFDEGLSSRNTYTGQTEAAEYGFELNLGLSFGFSVSTEKKEENLDDAQFLGAPQGGNRSYVPYSYCAN